MQSNPELSRALESYFDNSPITALVVCTKDAQGNSVDYTCGHIDNTLKTKVSSNNLFGVGSITKTFVAAALMQLQEKNALHISDPIGKYISDYPRWQGIPIYTLLNMTSGIANYTDLPLFNNLINSDNREVIAPQTLIDSAYQADDLCAPLSEWRYSNTNYLLLGLILQKVAQNSVEHIFDEQFCKPLGLKHTFYSDTFYDQTVLAQMVHGYHKNKDVSDFNASLPAAAGSMVMNAHDLMTWTKALFTPGIILSQSSIDAIQTTVKILGPPPWPSSGRFGLGVISFEHKKHGTIWYYTGVINGYTSFFGYTPKSDKVYVVQAASWPDPIEEILFPEQELLETLLDLE